MARNAETIRQWRLLREIEASHGVTIRQMAELTGVTTRTIRRDLDALQEAGFALYDQSVDGERRWMLRTGPFRSVDEAGFTLGELSALYFGRTLMDCLVGMPFHEDLTHAFAKLERAMGPHMRAFLNRLPDAIQAKPGPKPPQLAQHLSKTINRLLDGALHQQRLSMRYHSLSSGREKTYRIDPYRLVYAQGGLYLFAYVPSYGQVRTFAVDRIRGLTPLDETFDVVEDNSDRALTDSLGIHEGTPEHIEVEFTREAAPFVVERVWHPSQTVSPQRDGSVIVGLDVCADAALKTWVLGFGSRARILTPSHLATEVAAELTEASARYANHAKRPRKPGR